ncbi:hypothetical protein B0H14DRAFT_1702452 [Mycena olivaceomarginata]|nr:hypothetical protein B0H14DRAFT_1702452 [Mycena olivaceomarginata]
MPTVRHDEGPNIAEVILVSLTAQCTIATDSHHGLGLRNRGGTPYSDLQNRLKEGDQSMAPNNRSRHDLPSVIIQADTLNLWKLCGLMRSGGLRRGSTVLVLSLSFIPSDALRTTRRIHGPMRRGFGRRDTDWKMPKARVRSIFHLTTSRQERWSKNIGLEFQLAEFGAGFTLFWHRVQGDRIHTSAGKVRFGSGSGHFILNLNPTFGSAMR